ncbi:MAG TPA: hypothetical protein VJ851_13275 [Jatrophihabitans sp.]|nr:hypothetical protein [Jatrophihabitans sp.]
MAVIHNTTLQPTKLELLARWLPEQPWYHGAGSVTKAGGFRLDDPAGEVGIEFMVVLAEDGQAYLVPMTYRAEPLADAADGLIGTAEHGVLGRRWIYHGECDPVLRAQLAALLAGEVSAQAQSQSHALDPTIQIRTVAGSAAVRLSRLLTEDEPPEAPVGYVSAPWRRLDGSTARGIVATASR